MHADLPTDLERLRDVETYLSLQLDRALQQHARPGAHEELPPDRGRLEPVGRFLRTQLGRVRQQIHEVTTGDPGWLTDPATGWYMQHLPAGGEGGRGRGVLHRDGCWITEGTELDRDAAVLALIGVRDAVDPCEICLPERELLPPE
ncbi:DUF6233 domain-containing protein [Streptomyces sp. NPDC088732]|uniref:DUF6233 domain-containing protein n=1 Tax=Streptomyces sp. NPDC088732 TaxID=3365879 RepID=UPI0038074EB8